MTGGGCQRNGCFVASAKCVNVRVQPYTATLGPTEQMPFLLPELMGRVRVCGSHPLAHLGPVSVPD